MSSNRQSSSLLGKSKRTLDSSYTEQFKKEEVCSTDEGKGAGLTVDATLPTTLNPTLFKKWTKEEVCSLLCTDEEKGGAGLTVEEVKPLYDTGFDGTSLSNIVTFIQDKEKYFALDRVKSNRDYQSISQTTLENVVIWVDNLLKTRLYHLWSTEHAKEQLCKDVMQGGAGLKDIGFDNLKSQINSSSITSVLNNLARNECNLLIKNWIESIQFSITISKSTLEVNVFKSFTKQQLETIRNKQINNILLGRNNMPFIGTQTLGENLYEQMKLRELKSPSPREKSLILAFSGAPGIGKTRCALEGYSCLVSFIQDHDQVNPISKDILDGTCFFFALSFNNGMNLGAGEISLTNEQLVEEIILSRLIKIYVRDYDNSFKSKGFNSIFDFFEQLVSCQPSNQPTIIYLVIDEYQLLVQISKLPKMRNGLDVVCKCIGDCISRLSEKNCLFIPIFSGLDQLSLEKSIKDSTYPYIPLQTTRPRLHYWDLNYIFSHFFQNFPNEAKCLKITRNTWTRNPNLVSILHYVAGLPRLVSSMITKMTEVKDVLDPWKHVETILSQPFGKPTSFSDPTVGPIILANALTEHVVQRYQTFVKNGALQIQEYEQKEYFFLKPMKDGFIVSLPHWKVIETYSGKNDSLLEFTQNLQSLITSKESIFTLHDRKYEIFNARHLIALVESFILLGQKQVKMKDLFRGAIFSTSLKNLSEELIELCSLKYLLADSTSNLFENHLQFENETNRSFDRKLKFKTDQNKVIELFFQDRGIDITKKTYNSLPTIAFNDLTKLLKDLPSSSNELKNILVVTTTKYISNDMWSEMQKCRQDVILLGHPSVHSNIDRSKYGIQHFYRGDLFDLMANIFIPQIIFIKEYKSGTDDHIIIFLFKLTNSKQCLQNIYNAIPKSNNLDELIMLAGLSSNKVKSGLTDDVEESKATGKILVDFTPTITMMPTGNGKEDKEDEQDDSSDEEEDIDYKKPAKKKVKFQ